MLDCVFECFFASGRLFPAVEVLYKLVGYAIHSISVGLTFRRYKRNLMYRVPYRMYT